jgi:hypothetical protein
MLLINLAVPRRALSLQQQHACNAPKLSELVHAGAARLQGSMAEAKAARQKPHRSQTLALPHSLTLVEQDAAVRRRFRAETGENGRVKVGHHHDPC